VLEVFRTAAVVERTEVTEGAMDLGRVLLAFGEGVLLAATRRPDEVDAFCLDFGVSTVAGVGVGEREGGFIAGTACRDEFSEDMDSLEVDITSALGRGCVGVADVARGITGRGAEETGGL
jgi:hypothetical protein